MNAPDRYFHDIGLRQRLWNWGKWRWSDLMSGSPDSSCANPLYEQFIWNDGKDGDGEITEDTVIVAQDHAAKGEQEPPDEEDAKEIHAAVGRLMENHIAVLCVRFVFRLPCKTPEAKDRLQRAVFELGRVL